MLKAILKRMSCIRSILLLVLIVGGLVSVQAEEQWSEVRSPHFNVLTNRGEQRGRDVVLQFEQMRSLFAQLFFKDQVDPSIPLQIVGLKNQKQLSGYAPLFQGKPVDIAGFYLRSHLWLQSWDSISTPITPTAQKSARSMSLSPCL